MTCQNPLIEHTDVADWTTLDYALAPPHFRDAFTFEGSKFQQLVNSRRLPLIFSLKTRVIPFPPKADISKRDYHNFPPFMLIWKLLFSIKRENKFAFLQPAGGK